MDYFEYYTGKSKSKVCIINVNTYFFVDNGRLKYRVPHFIFFNKAFSEKFTQIKIIMIVKLFLIIKHFFW